MARLSGLGPLSIRQPTTRNKTHTNAHKPIPANRITEKSQSIKDSPAKPQSGTPYAKPPEIMVFLTSQPHQPPMKVKVNHESTNHSRYRLRFTLPRLNQCCEFVSAENWTRKTSSEALNLLERVYGIKRENVRFVHQ